MEEKPEDMWWNPAVYPTNSLLDMKWVQDHDARTTDTPGTVAARKFMKEKPGDFLALLTKLEAEYWALVKEQTGQSQVSEGPSEREEIMEKLMAEEWEFYKTAFENRQAIQEFLGKKG